VAGPEQLRTAKPIQPDAPVRRTVMTSPPGHTLMPDVPSAQLVISVTVNTRMGAVGRWQPDSPARPQEAALALYEERGFDQATAAEIAAMAGVTERTFLRHFADKRCG